MKRDLAAKHHKPTVISERLHPLSCGTGKNHLAQALGHIAVRRGYDTVFSTHAKLLGQLASARAVGTYERKLAALSKAVLLIIDAFDLKPMRPGLLAEK
jgi:DNA replication protein DnaC